MPDRLAGGDAVQGGEHQHDWQRVRSDSDDLAAYKCSICDKTEYAELPQ